MRGNSWSVECVCLLLFGGVDQSEEVWETVVTAPNLLYQLPSVLTDTVSFSKRNCHQPLYRFSRPVSSLSRSQLTASLSSQPTPVFFNTHAVFHTMEVPFLCCVPLPNPFVEISFLSFVCVKPVTQSLFSNSAVTWGPKSASSHFLHRSCVLRVQIWLSVFPPP